MITGGLAGSFGEIVTIPLDTAKIRMQVQSGENKYQGLLDCLRRILKQEGFLALYKGLSAGVLRQIIYGSLRIGLFSPVKSFYQDKLYGHEKNSRNIALRVRIAAAVTTGSFGILIANPTDVLKVIFQADGRKSLKLRRYLSLRHAFLTIL